MSWVAEELFVECTSIEDVLNKTVSEFRKHSESGVEIHYVAGTISSDGDEHIGRNLQNLIKLQEKVAGQLGERALVLTSPAIFTPQIYSKLKIFESFLFISKKTGYLRNYVL